MTGVGIWVALIPPIHKVFNNQGAKIMNRKEAEALHSAMEDEGCEDLRLHDDYSGRGMYGKDTWAISGDFSWCVVAVAWAQVCVGDDEYQPNDLAFTFDSLGLGTVIY